MYIIGGLIIVKLIHMRDSTISINAFLVFISLGVIILFTVVGIVSHSLSACILVNCIAVTESKVYVNKYC